MIRPGGERDRSATGTAIDGLAKCWKRSKALKALKACAYQK